MCGESVIAAKIYRSPTTGADLRLGRHAHHPYASVPAGGPREDRAFFRSCRGQFLNNRDRKLTLSVDELKERLWA